MNHVHCTLYLTKRNLWVVSPLDTSRALFEQQWDGADCTRVFEQLVQHFGITHLTVILGHDISYVLIIPQVASAHEDDIWSRIQEHVPVDVSDRSNAAWRTIADPGGSSATLLQVLAVDRAYLATITAASIKTGIHIQAVTGIGIVLGGYASSSTGQLLLWESLERLAVTAVMGNVYGVTALPQSLNASFYLNHRSYAQSVWQITLASVLMDGRTAPENLTQIPKEFTVSQLTIDPFLYDPTRTADPWKTVVVLPKFIQKKQVSPVAPVKTNSTPTGSKHPSMLIIIGSFVIVLLLIALWFVFNFRY